MLSSALPEDQDLEFARDFFETSKQVVEKGMVLPVGDENKCSCIKYVERFSN